MKTFHSLLSFLLIALLIISAFVLSAGAEGCFSIVVGKDASADGFVIMAHNEDDGPPQVVNHYKIPRMRYPSGKKVKLINGGELEQIEETWAYLWSEMPGMIFSDSYVNEWGVCIASDNCPSREDQAEITDGGISYMLRKLVAQRAQTAREGVLIAGNLIERFGYTAPGRTYIICDPNEGWFFCAVQGKHWLAARVPDDQVAMIANTYAVHQVDLTDSNRVLACGDIVDYAVSRGWYDPDKDGSFDFAAAYANPAIASDSNNVCRQWSGLRRVASHPIPLSPHLPFSVTPAKKLGVADVFEILRDHYEGTEFYQTSPEKGNPHENDLATICNRTTQTSFVVQLRADRPLDVGIVYWVSLSPPCTSVFLPYHFGIEDFPVGYSGSPEQPSNELYQKKVTAPFTANPAEAFWTFSNSYHKINGNYADMVIPIKKKIGEIENRALSTQKTVEETALQLYSTDHAAALNTLFNYSNELYISALEAMDKVLSGK